MPILVKDRDMPDTCGSCPCFHAESPMYCQAVKAAVQKPRIVHPYAKGRSEWCPLIYVPEPHGDLIDRYALLKSMEMNGNPKTVSDHINNIVRFLDALMDAPAVILAEPPKEES